MAFESHKIVTQHISGADLRTYLVGFDLNVFQYESLSDLIMDAIVDFAFGYHTGILNTYNRRQLKEAAKSLYRIKEYKTANKIYVDDNSEIDDENLKPEQKEIKRGEFGELILHVILRDFLETIPLLSKVYFKDADGATIHGFDAVHVGPDIKDSKKKSLFFGESKLYARKKGNAGELGITDLIEDITAHFKSDFLYREFALIYKKNIAFITPEKITDKSSEGEYREFLKIKDEWYEKINQAEQKKMKLQTILDSITIPLLCTYQSKVLSTHNDENTDAFKQEYEREMQSLKNSFDQKLKKITVEKGEPIRTDLNIVLMLFPIPSKKELVKLLHKKLLYQQNA